ncbi:MAG: hypothetical protein AAB426_10065 [Myxococcota bacterium]
MCFALASCRGATVNYDSLACDSGRCLAGYICHPEMGVCVPEIALGCDGVGTACADAILVGDTCAVPGSFVACPGGTLACDRGCRTCLATRAWSICSRGECLADTDADGVVDCIDDCPVIANGGQEDGDRDGIGDVCDTVVSTRDYVASETQVTSGGGVQASSAYVVYGAMGQPSPSENASPAGAQYRLVESYVGLGAVVAP